MLQDVSRLLLSVGGVKHTSSVLPLTLGDAQLGMSDETVTMPCQLATMASSCWPKFHGLVSVVDAWDSTKLSQADVTGAKYDATYGEYIFALSDIDATHVEFELV